VELPGGESGNTEHTWGMYNKPTGCSTPAYGAPHKQANKQKIVNLKRRHKSDSGTNIFLAVEVSNTIGAIHGENNFILCFTPVKNLIV
jgi:hypothetical protein